MIWPRAFIIARFNNGIHLPTTTFSILKPISVKNGSKYAKNCCCGLMFDGRKFNNGNKTVERTSKKYINESVTEI